MHPFIPTPTAISLSILLTLYLRDLLHHLLTRPPPPPPPPRKHRRPSRASTLVRRFRRLKCLWAHRRAAEQRRAGLTAQQRAVVQGAVCVVLAACLWMALCEPGLGAVLGVWKAGMVAAGAALYVALLRAEVECCGG